MAYPTRNLKGRAYRHRIYQNSFYKVEKTMSILNVDELEYSNIRAALREKLRKDGLLYADCRSPSAQKKLARAAEWAHQKFSKLRLDEDGIEAPEKKECIVAYRSIIRRLRETTMLWKDFGEEEVEQDHAIKSNVKHSQQQSDLERLFTNPGTEDVPFTSSRKKPQHGGCLNGSSEDTIEVISAPKLGPSRARSGKNKDDLVIGGS